MGLTVHTIELVAFRNYAHASFELGEELTVLVGPNATGKTAVIEALQIATTGASFRKPRWQEVVRDGSSEARVLLRAKGDGREVALLVRVDAAGSKSHSVNGTDRKGPAGIAGIIPCVVFTPDDLQIVKGPAEGRRAAVDDLGSQLSSTYAALKKEYARVLRQRNSLLKQEAAQGDLRPWDEQLVDKGSRLMQHRARLVERTGSSATRIYSDLAGAETFLVEYRASWDRGVSGAAVTPDTEFGERLHFELEKSRTEEQARRVTVIGPHRDDLAFVISGTPARSFASQGQQRTAALAWKLAEVEVITDITGATPLLLLDDVMSELDESRRSALAALTRSSVQTVVTTTNIHYFDAAFVRDAVILETSGG